MRHRQRQNESDYESMPELSQKAAASKRRQQQEDFRIPISINQLQIKEQLSQFAS